MILKEKYNLSKKTEKNVYRFCEAALPEKSDARNRRIIYLIMAWLIFIDRAIESPQVSTREAKHFLRSIEAAFSENKKAVNIPGPFRFHIALIQKIANSLKGRSPHPQIWKQWTASVKRCVKAMILEKKHSPEIMPTLAAYLDNGTHSIGAEIILFGIIILIRPKVSFPKIKSFDIICSAIKENSLIFRLINDLGSYDRERLEQKISGVLILESKLASEEKAKKVFYDKISQHRRNYNKLVKKIPPAFLASFRTHSRLLNFSIHAHQINDYEEK